MVQQGCEKHPSILSERRVQQTTLDILLTQWQRQTSSSFEVGIHTIHVHQAFDPPIKYQGGLFLPSPLHDLKPKISPKIPGGLGTGHSLFAILFPPSPSISLSTSASPSTSPTPGLTKSFDSVVSSLRFSLRQTAGLRLRFLGIGVPSSAYSTRGAGQGRACGKATTKKDAKSVVAKREEVRRERGEDVVAFPFFLLVASYLKAANE